MQRRNEEKAALLYDYLDASRFFKNPVEKPFRSMMNVTFTSPSPELDKAFCTEAAQNGLVNLKGHRSVGGMRASIYNAMPLEGVQALVAFMQKFEGTAYLTEGEAEMYFIQTRNNIAPKGLAELPAQQFAVEAAGPKAMCRAFWCAAPPCTTRRPAGRAAGHCPRRGGREQYPRGPRAAKQGIVVFNTPGANANAVMELVLAGLVLASRDVAGGIAWAKTLAGEADAAKQVEKGKSQFAGPELLGKTLGVVGLGAIGVRVANLAVHLGMNVLGYDPIPLDGRRLEPFAHVHHCTSISRFTAKAITSPCTCLPPKTPWACCDTDGLCPDEAGRAHFKLCPRRAGQRPGAGPGAGKRALRTLCNRFPHPGNAGPAGLCVHSAPGGLHAGKRGKLRCDGRAPAARLPAGRQHCQQRKLPRCLYAAHRGRARVRDPPQRARHSGGHHPGGHGGKAEHREHGTNKSKGQWAYTMLDLSGPADEQMARGIAQLPDVVRVRVV